MICSVDDGTPRIDDGEIGDVVVVVGARRRRRKIAGGGRGRERAGRDCVKD